MNFCKDCKHYQGGRQFDYCLHPKAKRNPVTGNCFADFERSGGNCGATGKLFEQREKKIGFFKRLLG
jgi:hypothetical protein